MTKARDIISDISDMVDQCIEDENVKCQYVRDSMAQEKLKRNILSSYLGREYFQNQARIQKAVNSVSGKNHGMSEDQVRFAHYFL